MTDRGWDVEGVTNALLNGVLPSTGVTPVATTRIGEKEQLLDFGIRFIPSCFQPCRDGISGKFRRVIRGSHDHQPFIANHIVNAVGIDDGECGRAKVMIGNSFCLATPDFALIMEIANQFLLFSVNAESGLAASAEPLFHLGDVFELPIALGMFGFGDHLSVHLQREIGLLKQSADGVRTPRKFATLQFAAGFVRAFASPFQRAHGIPGGRIFHQGF